MIGNGHGEPCSSARARVEVKGEKLEKRKLMVYFDRVHVLWKFERIPNKKFKYFFVSYKN